MMASLARRHLGQVPLLFGFDSFEGMPATEVALDGGLASDWAENTFSDTRLSIPNYHSNQASVVCATTT